MGKQLRGQAALATVDTAKHAEVAAFFDVKPSGALPAPTLMAFALDESIKYVHSGALSADAIAAFASDATAGKATVHLRSQPPPESAGGSGAPVELVGSTFAQVAHDSSKDVLVQFYAPTCGHCNKLKPVYASVAAHFADGAWPHGPGAWVGLRGHGLVVVGLWVCGSVGLPAWGWVGLGGAWVESVLARHPWRSVGRRWPCVTSLNHRN